MKQISVITVVYNDFIGLKKTVESVVNQTYNNFEFIIVDGGSTDGSVEYAKSVEGVTKYVSEKDNGIYNAMNKAIDMAEGKYCIFMNAGDTFYDNDTLLQSVAQMCDHDFYVGGTIEVGKETQRFGAEKLMSILFLLTHSIYHQSTFTKTSLLQQHHYREDLKIVSDWAFFFEMWLKGATYAPLDNVVSYYFLGGFSAQHVDLIDDERVQVIAELLPLKVVETIQNMSQIINSVQGDQKWIDFCNTKLGKKIHRSVYLSPLNRDFKILRNVLKQVFKDIFK